MKVLLMVGAERDGYLCRVVDDEDASVDAPGTLLKWLSEFRNDQESAREHLSWQNSFTAASAKDALERCGWNSIVHVYYFVEKAWHVYPVSGGQVGSGVQAEVAIAQHSERILLARASSIQHWLDCESGTVAGLVL